MAETNSLITELPKIIERGKKEAERILDNLSKKNKITLQTNELVRQCHISHATLYLKINYK